MPENSEEQISFADDESYRIVAETASDAIVKIDEDSTILFINRAGERIFGYTVGEMTGQSLVMLMPERLREVHLAGMKRYLETGERHLSWERLEIVGLHRDNYEFPIEVSFGAFSQGGKQFFIGVIRDISERKRVRATLRERERLAMLNMEVSSALIQNTSMPEILHACTEALVEHLDAAFARIWTLNADENVLELQASSGLYTHLDGEHSRIPVGKFKIGRIAQERQPHLTNSVSEDTQISDQEWANREGMVSFAGYPLIVEQRLVGVAAMFSRKSMTRQTLDALASAANALAVGIERKRSETALLLSEERYRNFINRSSEGIWRYEVEKPIPVDLSIDEQIEMMYRYGYLAECNDAMAKMYGFESSEQVVGARLNEFLDPSNPKNYDYLRAFAESNYRLHEAESQEKDIYGGQKYFLNNLVGVIEDGKIVRAWGTQRDITERRLVEDRIRYQFDLTQTITDNTQSCLLMMDAEGRGTFANPATEKITGYKPQELIGEILHEKIHHTRPDGTPFPIQECPFDNALPLQELIVEFEDIFVHKLDFVHFLTDFEN